MPLLEADGPVGEVGTRGLRVTSQDAVSSDATKGLGFVPDYRALAARDAAERARRGRS